MENTNVLDLATYKEITSQADTNAAALAEAISHKTKLEALWQGKAYRQVVLTGCGSTHYLSIAAAGLLQQSTGVASVAAPASELLLNPDLVYSAGSGPVLLIAISRSGSTTETVQAVRRFQEQARGDVLTITCTPDNALSKMGTLNMVLSAAAEESVAQTRSFSAMWTAACATIAIFAGNTSLLDELQRLQEICQRVVAAADQPMRQLGGDLNLDRVYFLGSGFRQGLAREASLKMKEMSLTHAEAFHFMEFRHGPMSMVNEHALVVGLLSDDPSGQERAVLTEMRALGGRLLLLSDKDVPGLDGTRVIFDSGLSEAARSILYMVAFQYLALGRAAAKGLNPDQPRNLTAVVVLDQI